MKINIQSNFDVLRFQRWDFRLAQLAGVFAENHYARLRANPPRQGLFSDAC